MAGVCQTVCSVPASLQMAPPGPGCGPAGVPGVQIKLTPALVTSAIGPQSAGVDNDG